MVVSSQNKEVSGYYNVCRHRGTDIAASVSNCKFFTSKFHGCVYDTEGRNRRIADESQFSDLDKRKLNLHAVECGIWNRFIFLNFGAQSRENLLEQLGESAVQLNDFPFPDIRVAGNWGAILERELETFHNVFQEGYYVVTVHSGTIKKYFTGKRKRIRGRRGCICMSAIAR
jgi:Rieske 2Fe-2S family protein